MLLKLPLILLSVLFISCVDEQINKVEIWKLDSFESEISCLIFPDSTEADNIIIETFLGLSDFEYLETELRLTDNGKFQILKGDQVLIQI